MQTKEVFFAAAVNQALEEELSRDKKVFMMGEDIGAYGGAFGVSRDLIGKFSSKRIIDTPISENSIVGMAIGASLTGLRPIVEIMYMDFILLAMDQIVNKAAKLKFISEGKLSLPLVIRTVAGGGRYYGPDHSQSLESLFSHIPGLIVIYPSTPYEAKSLLKAAIRQDSPVIFVEHKYLYGMRGPVADENYTEDIGKAVYKSKGDELTVVSYGRMLHYCVNALRELNLPKNTVELIDLRTIKPLDKELIKSSVRKTGRLLVVEECHGICSVGSQILNIAVQECFKSMKAAAKKLSAADLPIPFSPYLEDSIFPSVEQIKSTVKGMLEEKNAC